MSNQVQFSTFNFHSSDVRVITDPTGEHWFCGKDVCTILGYVNESLTLQKHCKPNGVSKRYLTDKLQRKQEAIFISEPNLYRLIIKSRKPEAEPFEAWAFGKDPNLQVIACSYSADLASRMNRDVQRIMDDESYHAIFPDSSLNSKRIATVSGQPLLQNTT